MSGQHLAFILRVQILQFYRTSLDDCFRQVLRTQSNIYDKDYLRKQLKAESRYYFSGIVNGATMTISISYEKILSTQKRESSKNQKQKQATKNNKGNRFSYPKTTKRGEIVCFAFFKKIEIVLITSFTILPYYIVRAGTMFRWSA